MEGSSWGAQGICQVCNMFTTVMKPSNYPFFLCHLCDRMPRGQVLMSAYLCEIRNMFFSLGDQFLRSLSTREQGQTEAEAEGETNREHTID